MNNSELAEILAKKIEGKFITLDRIEKIKGCKPCKETYRYELERIKFCPICGNNLSEIKSELEIFIENILDEHKDK